MEKVGEKPSLVVALTQRANNNTNIGYGHDGKTVIHGYLGDSLIVSMEVPVDKANTTEDDGNANQCGEYRHYLDKNGMHD